MMILGTSCFVKFSAGAGADAATYACLEMGYEMGIKMHAKISSVMLASSRLTSFHQVHHHLRGSLLASTSPPAPIPNPIPLTRLGSPPTAGPNDCLLANLGSLAASTEPAPPVGPSP